MHHVVERHEPSRKYHPIHKGEIVMLREGCAGDCDTCLATVKELKGPPASGTLAISSCVFSQSVAAVLASALQNPFRILRVAHTPNFSPPPRSVRCKHLQLYELNHFDFIDSVDTRLRSLDLRCFGSLMARAHYQLDGSRLTAFSNLKRLSLTRVGVSDGVEIASSMTQLQRLALHDVPVACFPAAASILLGCATLRTFSFSIYTEPTTSRIAFMHALAQATQLSAISALTFEVEDAYLEAALCSQLQFNSSLHKLAFYKGGHWPAPPIFEAAAKSSSLINIRVECNRGFDLDSTLQLFQSDTLQKIHLGSRSRFLTHETQTERLYTAILQHPAITSVSFPGLNRELFEGITALKKHNFDMYYLTLQRLLLYPPSSFRGDPLSIRRPAAMEN